MSNVIPEAAFSLYRPVYVEHNEPIVALCTRLALWGAEREGMKVFFPTEDRTRTAEAAKGLRMMLFGAPELGRLDVPPDYLGNDAAHEAIRDELGPKGNPERRGEGGKQVTTNYVGINLQPDQPNELEQLSADIQTDFLPLALRWGHLVLPQVPGAEQE